MSLPRGPTPPLLSNTPETENLSTELGGTRKAASRPHFGLMQADREGCGWACFSAALSTGLWKQQRHPRETEPSALTQLPGTSATNDAAPRRIKPFLLASPHASTFRARGERPSSPSCPLGMDQKGLSSPAEISRETSSLLGWLPLLLSADVRSASNIQLTLFKKGVQSGPCMQEVSDLFLVTPEQSWWGCLGVREKNLVH